MFVFFVLPIFLVGFRAFASCHSIPHVVRDNISTTTPTFNATISDHDGIDITSSFQIMLYQEPLKTFTNSNLTDRQAGSFRLINTCPLSSQTFVSSSCNHKDGTKGALQVYTVVCRHNPDSVWQPAAGSSGIIRRTGRCNSDEICITRTSQITLGGRQGVTVQTASCVSQRDFFQLHKSTMLGKDAGIEQAGIGLLRGLTQRRASAVVSQVDKQTPVEMDTLELEAGRQGEEVEKELCRDCLDLGTEKFPIGTDSLKVEARLLTAGAGVATGILWFAVVSG